MTPSAVAYHPNDAPARPGLLRRFTGAATAVVSAAFGALSLTLLLSAVVTVPIASFFTLGYMLRAAAEVATTGRIRDAFRGLRQASRLGQIALGAWLWTLPVRLAVSLHEDALLIDPASREARRLLWVGQASIGVALLAVLGGIAQGGRLLHFFRPIRGARALWSLTQPAPREEARASVKAFFAAFEVRRAWWLGLRGYLAAGAWLLVPTLLFASSDRRGIVAIHAAGLLALVVAWVPFLQLHVAVHDDLGRALGVPDIRYLSARAPLAFAFALAVTLLSALPLYLLKIESVPRDALWLPSIVFVTTIFPSKLCVAWAYHRGARRADPAPRPLVWLGRLSVVPVVLTYALVVYLSPSLGWHGTLGMFEHHAFLLPVPF